MLVLAISSRWKGNNFRRMGKCALRKCGYIFTNIYFIHFVHYLFVKIFLWVMLSFSKG